MALSQVALKTKKKVWALKDSGYTALQIADKLELSKKTVATVLSSPRPILDPLEEEKLKKESKKEKTPEEVKQEVKVAVEEKSKSIRDSYEWKSLEQEFTPDELNVFEEIYNGLMAQFQGNVVQSEHGQMMHACRIDLLMKRNLVTRKKAKNEADRLEKALFQHEMEMDLKAEDEITEADKKFGAKLADTLANARHAETRHTSEYSKLLDKYGDIMKDLKGTRDQRVKEFESADINFFQLLKNLRNKNTQQREARQMELVALAGEKAYERLSQVHTYEDNSKDRPLLTAEVLEKADEEENNE